jgi:hypothetical protein
MCLIEQLPCGSDLQEQPVDATYAWDGFNQHWFTLLL